MVNENRIDKLLNDIALSNMPDMKLVTWNLRLVLLWLSQEDLFDVKLKIEEKIEKWLFNNKRNQKNVQRILNTRLNDYSIPEKVKQEYVKRDEVEKIEQLPKEEDKVKREKSKIEKDRIKEEKKNKSKKNKVRKKQDNKKIKKAEKIEKPEKIEKIKSRWKNKKNNILVNKDWDIISKEENSYRVIHGKWIKEKKELENNFPSRTDWYIEIKEQEYLSVANSGKIKIWLKNVKLSWWQKFKVVYGNSNDWEKLMLQLYKKVWIKNDKKYVSQQLKIKIDEIDYARFFVKFSNEKENKYFVYELLPMLNAIWSVDRSPKIVFSWLWLKNIDDKTVFDKKIKEMKDSYNLKDDPTKTILMQRLWILLIAWIDKIKEKFYKHKKRK